MATRMQQRRGTAAEWTSANPILGAGEIGFETDNGQFKIGDGSTTWENLPYFQTIDGLALSFDLEDLADVEYPIAPEEGQVLRFENGVWEPHYTKVPVIFSASKPFFAEEGRDLFAGDLWFDPANGKLYVYYEDYDSDGFWVEAKGPTSLNNQGSTGLINFPAEPTDGQEFSGYVFNSARGVWHVLQDSVEDLANVIIIDPQNNDTLLYDYDGQSWENAPGVRLDEDGNIPLTHLTLVQDAALQDAISAIVNSASENFETLAAAESYISANIPLSSDVPALTVKTTEDWSTDTSIPIAGSLNVELASGVKFKIGDGASTFASLEYVPTIDSVDAQISAGITGKANIDGPTFTGTVSLPATTSIGDVTATEIEYLEGVSSNIQTQLTDLDTTKANIESPTFTGTVSGITASMVGLSSVDNTSDLDKPISTATQTALDGKLSLSGGTMTGKITLDGDPTQALHAVTKQYVDSVEAGLVTRPAVKAATTANLSGTYDNGTAGAGATLNLGQLATLDIDGVTSWSQWNGILVKNQTNAFENGRYVVFQLGNDTDTDWILRRCPLCDEADEIPGSYIFVTDGTVNAQTGWVQHVDDPATFTVGTDDIDVYQFAGAGTITAGTNVSVSGNQVSVVDAPVFSGTIDASAAGIEFSDGVQTKAGVPSLTTFVEKTTSYTLDTLDHQDNIIEMNSASAVTFTIPTNSALAWPVGASMDIFQTGAGEVTIAGDSGVTVNATPGLKLRTQWSSATILKRGTDSWVVYGDLKS